MNFVLINEQDIKENIIIKEHNIDNKHVIREVLLQEKELIQVIKSKSNFLNNIKKSLYKRKFEILLKKALALKKTKQEKWYYMLGARLAKNSERMKYVTDILETLGGQKYVPLSEMNTNLSMYIEEYLNKNGLKSYESKLLFAYKDSKNINFDMIMACIKEYKTINIYLTEKPTSLILDKISKINKEEGTSIEIIKYGKKAFFEYNVIYFADDLRTNHPRIRLNKSALVVDELDASCDKYNSNILFFNNFKEKTKEIDNLKEQYGLLKVASIVRKIVN